MAEIERMNVTMPKELAALKADIEIGLADVAADRVKTFDAARIVERGRKLLADRSPSA